MEKRKKRTIGDITIYYKNGEEIYRKSHNDVGNRSKTVLQEATRCRMKNVQNLWTAFKVDGWIPRYQNKGKNQSDYNIFTSHTLHGINIYLPERESENYASVLVPLTISEGSLPPIGIEFDGTGVRSNISVGNMTVGQETKICDLARAIMFNNQGFQKGDTITFVACSQTLSPPFGYPRVRVRYCELALDLQDERPLSLLRHSAEAFSVREGYIASMVAEGACSWVHESRGKGQKSAAYSTQTMWCSNDEMIARYSGETALKAAIASDKKLKEKQNALTPDPSPEDLSGKI